jgi:hypothetical protein
MEPAYTSIWKYWLSAFFPVHRYSRKTISTEFSKSLLLTGILLFSLNTTRSQPTYSVHANIIYHFTKYIDWSADKKTGNFVIGVLGSHPLYDELKRSLAHKKVGHQAIIIKKLSKSATAFDCHILFIGDDDRGSLKRIVAATAGTATLLVTESEGAARKGSCINFLIIEDCLTLEINKTNIERKNLQIATELLSLGVLVK